MSQFVVFALHGLAIVHGLAASLAWFFAFYLAGLSLAPRRSNSLLIEAGTPPALGAAAYVLVCWFGIQSDVRLTPLALGFLGASIVLALLRRRSVAAVLRSRIQDGEARGWLALFAALYVVGYLFVLPPPSREHLPLAWLGNVDVFQYLIYAQHVLHLGPSPVGDVSTHSYVYFQTPGTFFLLDGLSLLFGSDPMRAAMPAILAPAALAGVVAAYVSRRIFGLTRGAWLVGVITVTGPFFRFLQGHYYLSTMLALPVLVHLMLLTIGPSARRLSDGLRLAVAFLAHYALLLFVYPYLLLIGLGFQAAAILFIAVSSWQEGERPVELLRRTGLTLAAVVLAAGVLSVAVPKHVIWVSAMLRLLSQTGLWGWALDVISPFAMLGVPAVMTRTQATNAAAHAAFLGSLWLLGAGGVLVVLFPRLLRDAAREQRVFLGLAGLGFLGYAGYFTLVGPSYQQWKLASYTALPLAFVFVAEGFRLLEGRAHAPSEGATAKKGSRTRRWASVAVTLTAFVLVGGNAVVHAVADPPFRRLPGALRNLASLDGLAFRELSFETGDILDALLVSYFLPSKRLHVSMPGAIPDEPIALESISPARPLLALYYSCEGIGHRDVRPIEGAGCLVLQPPSLAPETSYPFSHTFMFIEPSGLDRREDWGRWNRRGVVELKLLADPRRLQLNADAAWLNLRLQPSLAPGMAGQRVRFAWGARKAELLLGEPAWVSLPLRGGDWTGEWLATQLVSVELPDRVPPHWVDGRYLENRSLAVGFLELSVSARPRGRIVAPLQ